MVSAVVCVWWCGVPAGNVVEVPPADSVVLGGAERGVRAPKRRVRGLSRHWFSKKKKEEENQAEATQHQLATPGKCARKLKEHACWVVQEGREGDLV